MSAPTVPALTRSEPAPQPLWSRRTLISPATLSYLYLAYALVAFLFPPQLYERLIYEPYRAGMNYKMLVFAIACVVFFRIGLGTVNLFQNRPTSMNLRPEPNQSVKNRGLAGLAIIIIAVNLASAQRIIQQNYEIVASIFIHGQRIGSRLKTEFVSDDAMLAANPLLIFLVWILYAERMSGNKSRIIQIMMIAAISLSVFISVIKLARYELIPLVIGLAVIKLRSHYRKREASAGRIWRTVGLYSAAVVGIFAAFATIRDQSTENGVAANSMGYTIASFNRLAAILDGRLQFNYAGSGTYLLNLFGNLPIIGSKYASFLPDNTLVYRSEFADIRMAGLDTGYNWVTTYGYYLLDAGILVVFVCFLLGIVAQVAWKSFCRNGIFGTAVYPYLAFALILSFGSYWLTRPIVASYVVFFALYFVSIGAARMFSKGAT